VLLGKGVCAIRKSFENANHPAIMMQRNCRDRGYFQAQAYRWVGPVVLLRVIAPQHFSCSKTLAGNAGVDTQAHSQIGGAFSAPADANNYALAAQGKGSRRGVSKGVRGYRDSCEKFAVIARWIGKGGTEGRENFLRLGPQNHYFFVAQQGKSCGLSWSAR
jgi:hypothetical protein